MKTIPEWVRWILVLPAAIVGYVAVQFFVAIGNSVGPGPEWLTDYWCQFVNSIAGPCCFVWVGVRIAPRYSFIVSVVLTVLFSIVTAVLVTMAIMIGRHSPPVWWLITSTVLGIIATIYMCAHFHQEDKAKTGLLSI